MNPVRPALQNAGSIVSATSLGDTTVTVVAINTWAKQTSNVDFATHKLVIPANAICSLALSSYGPTEWDQPCIPETGTVLITVRSWSDAAGHVQTTFHPAMRFNPAADPVTLTVRDRVAAQPGLALVFCTDAGQCVDEGLTDRSLVTVRQINGNYFRRLKHFSGYYVTT